MDASGGGAAVGSVVRYRGRIGAAAACCAFGAAQGVGYLECGGGGPFPVAFGGDVRACTSGIRRGVRDYAELMDPAHRSCHRYLAQRSRQVSGLIGPLVHRRRQERESHLVELWTERRSATA